MLIAGFSHGKSCAGVTEWLFWKNKVLFIHGRTDSPQFLPCRIFLVSQFLWIRLIWQPKSLATNYNDDWILIQSLELHRELPARPSAEQAVKVPLQPLQGSGDSAKCDDNSVSLIFPVFHWEISKTFPSRNLCRSPEWQQAAQCAFEHWCSERIVKFGSFKKWCQWQSPAN
jgi:hypothetical protein